MKPSYQDNYLGQQIEKLQNNPEQFYADATNLQQPKQQQDRRKYPKDLKGAKDEWKGMVKHQTESIDVLKQIENESKIKRIQDLKQDYEKKLNQQELLKQQRHEQKMREHEEAERKTMEAFQQQQFIRQNQRYLQSDLAHNYEDLKIEQQHQKQQQIENNLTQDSKMIQQNLQLKSLQEQNHRHRQLYLVQTAQQDMQEKALMKQQLERQKALEKEIHNQHMTTFQEKELNKLENYRRYYNQCDEMIRNKQQAYLQQVCLPLSSKMAQREQFVEKNIQEVKARQMQNEIQRNQMHSQQLHEVTNNIKSEINRKQNDKQRQMQETMNQQMQQRSLDSQQYQNYMQYRKDQKLNQQQQYKEYLEQQLQIEHHKKLAGKQMAQHEKKINYQDLQAYKLKDADLYALLPGWSPQIGAHSTRVKHNPEPHLFQNTFQHKYHYTKQNQKTDRVTTQKIGAQSLYLLPSINQQPTIVKPNYQAQENAGQQQIKKQQQPIQSEVKKLAQNTVQTLPNDLTHQSMNDLRHVSYSPYNPLSYNHNPITNPIPFNMQNPVLLRQMQKELFNQKQMQHQSLSINH